MVAVVVAGGLGYSRSVGLEDSRHSPEEDWKDHELAIVYRTWLEPSRTHCSSCSAADTAAGGLHNPLANNHNPTCLANGSTTTTMMMAVAIVNEDD